LCGAEPRSSTDFLTSTVRSRVTCALTTPDRHDTGEGSHSDTALRERYEGGNQQH
jgi:hypothetical protein